MMTLVFHLCLRTDGNSLLLLSSHSLSCIGSNPGWSKQKVVSCFTFIFVNRGCGLVNLLVEGFNMVSVLKGPGCGLIVLICWWQSGVLRVYIRAKLFWCLCFLSFSSFQIPNCFLIYFSSFQFLSTFLLIFSRSYLSDTISFRSDDISLCCYLMKSGFVASSIYKSTGLIFFNYSCFGSTSFLKNSSNSSDSVMIIARELRTASTLSFRAFFCFCIFYSITSLQYSRCCCLFTS